VNGEKDGAAEGSPGVDGHVIADMDTHLSQTALNPVPSLDGNDSSACLLGQSV